MRIGIIEVKRRVWVGLGCAVTVTAVWWSWTQRPVPVGAPESVAAGKPQPFVRVAGGEDRVLRERADLFDPTPLFFPTEWNYGPQGLPENLQRQPGQVFGGFEAKLVFSGPGLKSYGVAPARVPEKLTDVLVQGNEAPLAGFGHIDAPQSSLPVRAAYLDVRAFSGGESIISQMLAGFQTPRIDYAPLEFIVVVDSAGVVGEPFLTSGSGWEEVDAFFRAYLVKTFRLGERLNPGRYRVLLGP